MTSARSTTDVARIWQGLGILGYGGMMIYRRSMTTTETYKLERRTPVAANNRGTIVTVTPNPGRYQPHRYRGGEYSCTGVTGQDKPR